MKFLKRQSCDARINDAILGISKEIQLLREKLEKDSDSLRGDISEVSSRVVEGNEMLKEILLKMDEIKEEIRDEIRESSKPWYSRMVCW